MKPPAIHPADEIWNILKEMSAETKAFKEEFKIGMEELRASQKETDRQQKETDRQLKETNQQLKREVQKVAKGLKHAEELFTGQWGKLVESLVEGDLTKLLNERGIEVQRNLTNLKKDHGDQRFEFDIVAVNGKEVVVVEVKTTLKVQDVDYFLEKLVSFTDFAPEYRGKKVYGAVAFLKVNQSSNTYAEKSGLFVIRATGNSSSIINQANFKPKAFSLKA